MTQRKRKVLYWVFKVASILVSCAFPILAIYERFPLWMDLHGAPRSIGAGSILIFLVVLFIFRRSVFEFMRNHMKLNNAPPLVGWLIMIAVAYVVMFVNKFLYDITIVLWMGFGGCAIGTFLTFVAENFLKMEKDNG